MKNTAQERWFGEYQSVSERPLREDERAAISKEVEKFRVRSKWLKAAAIAGLICFVIPLGLSPFIGTGGIWLVVPGAIALLYGSLNVRDAKRTAALFQSELDSGKVEQFEIPLDNRPLPAFDIAGPEGGEKPVIWRFEAYSPTGRLVRVPDDPKGELILGIKDVAQAPARLNIETFPSKLIVEPSDSQAAGSVRPLAQAEIQEINAIRASFSPKHSQLAVLAFLYCSFGAVFLPFQKEEDPQLRFGGSVAYGVVAVLVLFFNRSKIWNFIKLRQDARQAEAYILPHDHEIYQVGGARGTIEYLPHSKLVWTINGEPAWWRKG